MEVQHLVFPTLKKPTLHQLCTAVVSAVSPQLCHPAEKTQNSVSSVKGAGRSTMYLSHGEPTAESVSVSTS